MPSALPIPTVAELVRAYSDGINGERDGRADMRSGSAFNMLGGPAAIIFSREAQRDRDLFRACYSDTAEADDLTYRLEKIYGYARVLDSYGVGTAYIARATTTAGVGTIFAGTRIIANTSATDPRVYAVAADTTIGATERIVKVAIRATSLGAGVAIDTAVTPVGLRFDDALFDATLVPTALSCGDGSTFEPAAVYRARVRQARFNARVGYAAAIISALKDIGAANVAVYASNFTGDANDYGLNVVYVSDAGYASSTALINACKIALENVRVLGADLQVLPMSTQNVGVSMTVSLWQDPGNFNTTDLTTGIVAALVAYFDGRKNAFSYQRDAMAGAILRSTQAIQNVTFSAPTVDAGITTSLSGIPQWASPIIRYVLDTGAIQISFVGPQ